MGDDKKKPYSHITWLNDGDAYEISYEGQYSYKQLYKIMHSFLAENKYAGFYGGDKNTIEIDYEDRQAGGFRELKHRWRAKKKMSDWMETYLFVNVQILGLSKGEMMYKDRKFKVESGELNISLKAGYNWTTPIDQKKMPDMINNWAGKDAEKLMVRFFDDDRDAMLNKFTDEVIAFLDIVKQCLGLPRSQDVRLESFLLEPKGLPRMDTDAPEF